MILLGLILSCMIAGSLSCTDTQCKDPVLAKELMDVKFLPNGRQLGTLCPKVLTFLECERDFFECPGQSLEELTLSSDKETAAKSMAMLNGISLVRDLCDEESSFHQDYIGSVDCFRDNIEATGRKCRQDVIKPIESFMEEIYPSEGDEDYFAEEALKEVNCLSDVLEVACIIDNLGDSCGSVAQRTAMAALEKMKDFLKKGGSGCADLENAASLKSRFLDYLELEGVERDQVQDVFDLFKRRR